MASDPMMFVKIAANIDDLKTAMTQARAAVSEAGAGAKEAGLGFKAFGDQVTQLGEHLVEGLTVIALLHEAFNFTKEAFESAAALEDLSHATGVSIEDLQRFQYVGQGFGVNLDTMAMGVERLSAKLASGDANAVRAVQMLGLSVKDLIAAGPTEAFLQIAEATDRVRDPMMKGALATDEFGKMGRLLVPVLGQLRQGMLDVPKEAIITDANVEAANKFTVKLEHAWTLLKNLAVASAIDFSKLGLFNPDLIQPDFLEKLKTVGKDINLVSDAFAGPVMTNAQMFARRLQTLQAEALEPLTGAQQHLIDVSVKLGLSQKDIAESIGASEGSVKHYTQALKDADDEFEQMSKADEARNKLIVEGATMAEKAWTQYFANAASLYATDVQKVTIAADEKLTLAVQEATRKGISDVNYYNALWALRDQDIARDTKQRLDSDANSHEHFIKIAADAKAYYDFVSAHSDSFSQQFIEQQRLIAQTAEDTAVMWGTSFVTEADKAIAAIDRVASAQKGAASFSLSGGATPVGVYGKLTPQQLHDYGFIDLHDNVTAAGQQAGYGNSGAFAARAEGGPVSANTPYMVGERGPELFMPQTSGSIVPNGAGGSPIHIYITQPLGTPTAIAKAVDEALMARQRNTGQRT